MPKRNIKPSSEQHFAPGLTREMLPAGLPLAGRAPRHIVTRSGMRVRGELMDPRFHEVQWESEIEHVLLQALRVCRRVKRVFTQPLVLNLEGREYTPDCLVFLPPCIRIWFECKSRNELSRPDVIRDLAQAQSTLASLGDTFRVVDEEDVGLGSVAIDNAQLIALWTDFPCERPVKLTHPTKYSDLCSSFGSESVLAGIAQGWYTFDWESPITPDTLVGWDEHQTGYEPKFLRGLQHSSDAASQEGVRS